MSTPDPDLTAQLAVVCERLLSILVMEFASRPGEQQVQYYQVDVEWARQVLAAYRQQTKPSSS